MDTSNTGSSADHHELRPQLGNLGPPSQQPVTGIPLPLQPQSPAQISHLNGQGGSRVPSFQHAGGLSRPIQNPHQQTAFNGGAGSFLQHSTFGAPSSSGLDQGSLAFSQPGGAQLLNRDHSMHNITQQPSNLRPASRGLTQLPMQMPSSSGIPNPAPTSVSGSVPYPSHSPRPFSMSATGNTLQSLPPTSSLSSAYNFSSPPNLSLPMGNSARPALGSQYRFTGGPIGSSLGRPTMNPSPGIPLSMAGGQPSQFNSALTNAMQRPVASGAPNMNVTQAQQAFLQGANPRPGLPGLPNNWRGAKQGVPATVPSASVSSPPSTSANVRPDNGTANVTSPPSASKKTGAKKSPAGWQNKKHCNCKNSRCLKLYCECFASGRYCSDCNCVGCCNNQENESCRQSAVETILDRNPNAFRPKIQERDSTLLALKPAQHNKGCNCKKSNCLKKYCECFQAAIYCSENCKCVDCQNYNFALGPKGSAPPTKHSKVARILPPPHPPHAASWRDDATFDYAGGRGQILRSRALAEAMRELSQKNAIEDLAVTLFRAARQAVDTGGNPESRGFQSPLLAMGFSDLLNNAISYNSKPQDSVSQQRPPSEASNLGQPSNLPLHGSEGTAAEGVMPEANQPSNIPGPIENIFLKDSQAGGPSLLQSLGNAQGSQPKQTSLLNPTRPPQSGGSGSMPQLSESISSLEEAQEQAVLLKFCSFMAALTETVGRKCAQYEKGSLANGVPPPLVAERGIRPSLLGQGQNLAQLQRLTRPPNLAGTRPVLQGLLPLNAQLPNLGASRPPPLLQGQSMPKNDGQSNTVPTPAANLPLIETQAKQPDLMQSLQGNTSLMHAQKEDIPMPDAGGTAAQSREDQQPS